MGQWLFNSILNVTTNTLLNYCTLQSFPPCPWRAGRPQLWPTACRLLAPSNETVQAAGITNKGFYIEWRYWDCGIGFTCKQLPYGVQCGLSHCPLYQLEKQERYESGNVKCIFLVGVSPIVWGAAPRRNFTTAGWPNLQLSNVNSALLKLNLPCTIMESSFGCLVNCKQREALPIKVSKDMLILGPSDLDFWHFQEKDLNSLSPHCEAVSTSAHHQASLLSKLPLCFSPTNPRCPWR